MTYYCRTKVDGDGLFLFVEDAVLLRLDGSVPPIPL